MAGETLRTATELLAEFPDNVSGLIGAVASRDFVASVAPGVGFQEDDPAQVPYIIPMTDGVPVDFLSTLVAPVFFGNFWKLDGNNAFVPSYLDLGIAVPPASLRMVTGSIIFNLQKVGGGSGDFAFQGTEGGVLTGDPITRTLSAVAETLVFSGTRIYDVTAAGGISIDITPIGHSDDLQINDVRASLNSVML